MVMHSDTPSTFLDENNPRSNMSLAGYDMTKAAAKRLYEMTGISPDKINVCELHDCFSANELISYEALQLCPEGKAGEYIDKDLFMHGGKVVVNPSGGLISKGHPLGATGMAQCAELVWQLRNMAGGRQVKNAEYALQHNLGLGGAVVISIYKKKNNNMTIREDCSSDPEYLQMLENNGKLHPQGVVKENLETIQAKNELRKASMAKPKL